MENDSRFTRGPWDGDRYASVFDLSSDAERKRVLADIGEVSTTVERGHFWLSVAAALAATNYAYADISGGLWGMLTMNPMGFVFTLGVLGLLTVVCYVLLLWTIRGTIDAKVKAHFTEKHKVDFRGYSC